MRITKRHWKTKRKDKNGYYHLDQFEYEHDLQVAIIDRIEQTLPSMRPYVFAVPNGQKRNIVVAKKLKKEGVTSGVVDLFIDIPNLIKHGLRLELKVCKNKLSEDQSEFKNRMERVGYVVEKCTSLEDFEEILCDYFGLDRLTNQEIFSRIHSEEFIQNKYEGKYEPIVPAYKNR